MGKLIGLLVGVALWILIFSYVENGVLRAIALCAAIYLVAMYISSLSKKGRGT